MWISTFFITLLLITTSGVSSWDYHHSWANEGKCNGENQSPIDIVASKQSDHVDTLQAERFVEMISKRTWSVVIKKKGHSLLAEFVEPVGDDFLSCPQFHFHIDGSEHTLKGRMFFAEFGGVGNGPGREKNEGRERNPGQEDKEKRRGREGEGEREK